MYSDELSNMHFHEQMFFQIFVAKKNTSQFFWEKIAYEQYNFL